MATKRRRQRDRVRRWLLLLLSYVVGVVVAYGSAVAISGLTQRAGERSAAFHRIPGKDLYLRLTFASEPLWSSLTSTDTVQSSPWYALGDVEGPVFERSPLWARTSGLSEAPLTQAFGVGWPLRAVRGHVWITPSAELLARRTALERLTTDTTTATRGFFTDVGFVGAWGRNWLVLPVWRNLSINALLYGVMTLLLVRVWQAWRRQRRQTRGRCLDCGYQLAGLTRCPECATEAITKTRRPSPRAARSADAG